MVPRCIQFTVVLSYGEPASSLLQKSEQSRINSHILSIKPNPLSFCLLEHQGGFMLQQHGGKWLEMVLNLKMESSKDL